MSDSSQGPGWWIASDGKWYPPELHPDARAAAEAAESAETVQSAETEAAEAAATAEAADEHEPTATAPITEDQPVVGGEVDEASDEVVAAPTAEPDSPADETVAQTEAGGEPADAEDEADENTDDEPVAVGDDADDDAPTQTSAPVYLSAATASSAAATTREQWVPTSYSQPVATAEGPPVEGAEAEPGEAETPTVTATTNIVAGLIALIGAALIVVGSFLPWGEATGLLDGTVDGFDSNGVGTLIAGVVLAASAGLLLAGIRHILMLFAVLGASLATIGLAVYSMFDITGSASDSLVDEVIAVTGRSAAEVAATDTGLDVAYGLWMVLAGGAVGLISAMFVRFNE